MILKYELNARNKITTIEALAVPVLRYSFGIINWRTEEIKKIDKKTRKMLTMYNNNNNNNNNNIYLLQLGCYPVAVASPKSWHRQASCKEERRRERNGAN